MRLYLLRPIDDEADPWVPWYDKCFGMVVRAETRQQAREIASKEGCDEVATWQAEKWPNPWLDPDLSTCEQLWRAGDPGVIIQDVHSA
jgi:hypothetical protein